MALVPGNAAYSLSISAAGQTTTTLDDVLIGDVIVFFRAVQHGILLESSSGLPPWNIANYTQEIADSANYPKLRAFKVARNLLATPQEVIPPNAIGVGGAWVVTGPAITPDISAPGYFMARELYKRNGVPIGMIVSAYLGSSVDYWMNRQRRPPLLNIPKGISTTPPAPSLSRASTMR